MQLYSQSQIGSRVARIVRVAGKVDAELHVVLCSILSHTQEYGDYTAVLPLLNGLPKGIRLQGIAAWLKHFSGGQLVPSFDSKSKQWACTLAKGWYATLFDLVGAMAVTFGDFSPEPAPTTLTLTLLLKMLEDKATSTKVNADGTPKVSDEAKVLASKLVAFARAA